MQTIPSGSRTVLWLVTLLLFPLLALAQAGPRLAPGLDGRFLQLAHDVPGFGGYYFDANGDLNVYLTDLSKAPAVRAAVADVAAQRPHASGQAASSDPANIIIRHADYDFPQLNNWHARFTAASPDRGVTMIDTDEAQNRVFIGVTDNAAIGRVQSQLDRLGIPRAAVVVDVVPPITLATNLTQYYRPLVGGLQIDWSGTYCTLGVNVWYTNFAQGISGAAGFYTASHCSDTPASTDGTTYSQGGYQIATEKYDPPFFTNSQYFGCPSGYNCRHSDVTFAQYNTGIDGSHGTIAQTLSRGLGDWNAGSIDIASTNFTVSGTAGNPTVGDYRDKVGRTTGWTSGQVSHTCTDYYVSGHYTLCQDQVEAYADGGDSGSPVFTEGTGSNIGFGGIVWAKTGAGGFIYSNLDRIAADMGTAVNYLSH